MLRLTLEEQNSNQSNTVEQEYPCWIMRKSWNNPTGALCKATGQ